MLFRKLYPIKQFSPQSVINGYAGSGMQLSTARLNVQPLSPNDLKALPEGARTIKRIKTIGDQVFNVANQYTGVPGDQLLYDAHWYECKSCVLWDHITQIQHYKAEWVIMPETIPEGANNNEC